MDILYFSIRIKVEDTLLSKNKKNRERGNDEKFIDYCSKRN